MAACGGGGAASCAGQGAGLSEGRVRPKAVRRMRMAGQGLRRGVLGRLWGGCVEQGTPVAIDDGSVALRPLPPGLQPTKPGAGATCAARVQRALCVYAGQASQLDL